MTRSLRAMLVSLLVLGGWLIIATSAHAAAGDYGPWYPAPGSAASQKLYDPVAQPFNSQNVKEIANFSCLYPKSSGRVLYGSTIPADKQAILGGIFADATAQYNGSLVDSNGTKSRYGGGPGSTGPAGMDQFLADEKTLLAEGGWVRYSSNIEPTATVDPATWNSKYNQYAKVAVPAAIADYTKAFNTWWSLKKLLTGNKVPSDLKGGFVFKYADAKTALDNAVQALNAARAAESKYQAPMAQLAAMINPNTAAPLNLAVNVPEGCALNPVQVQGVRFLDIVENTGKFFTDLLLYIPDTLTSNAYNYLEPYAFLYTFWTPHTERGDTIFNVATSCAQQYDKRTGQLLNQAQLRNTCSNQQPLGFNQNNTSNQSLAQSMPWYISMALFFQWLISGFYFIILFAAAVLFMVRGNKNTQLNVLHLVPKLIASAILTLFAPFIIGALISFSNVFITSIFGFDQARSVGRISDVLSQSNTYVTVAGAFLAQVVQVVTAGFTCFFFAMFIVGSLLRQMVLMGLVVLAPIACFCLIVPRWQPLFNRFVRALLAVVFIPAVMAFILKMGISLNPIISSNGVGVTDLTGLIGLLLMVATLWAMTKAMKLGAAIATGNQSFTKSLTGRAMGHLGQAASMASIAGVPGMGAAARGLNAGARLGAAGEGLGASLVPDNKRMVGGGSTGSGMLGIGTGSSGRRSLGLPKAGESGFGAAGVAGAGVAGAAGGAGGLGQGLGGKYSARGLAARYQEFLEEKQAGRGEQRVSNRMAMQYKAEQEAAMAAREQELGHRMSRAERDEFQHGSFVRDDEGRVLPDPETGRAQRNPDGYVAEHGQVIKRKGNYFMVNAQSGSPAGPAGQASLSPGRVSSPGIVAAPVVASKRFASDAAGRPAVSSPTRPAGPPSAPAKSGSVRRNAIGEGRPAAIQGSGKAVASAAVGAAPVTYAATGVGLPDTHDVCPRCGGPTKAGQCPNPSCVSAPPRAAGAAKPPTPRRRRQNVSTPADADALIDASIRDRKLVK